MEAGGVEREEEGRKDRPTCLDPLGLAKAQWFRTITSDNSWVRRDLEETSISRDEVWLVTEKSGSNGTSRVPLVHTASFLARG